MIVNVEETPDAEDLKTISKGIQSYNQDHLPDEVAFEKDTKFAVFARDDNDVVGGIRAVAYWNYCIIELLWLSDKVRSKGIGTLLLSKAEEHAKGLGVGYMRIDTTSFQAKPFYEKQGYKIMGELPDHPKGHTTYCLIKKL